MIVSYPLNGITYNAEDAQLYTCTRTSGVYSAEDMFAVKSVEGRTVTIGKGLAWFRPAEYMGFASAILDQETVTIPMADGLLPRIDRILYRWDKARNAVRADVLVGTPNSEPVPPEISRMEELYDLVLYDVRVPASSVTVELADITSTMLDESVCGIMRDGVTGLPTAQIQAQAEELIEQLQKAIAGIVSGSEMMLKTEYDPKGLGVDVTTQVYTHSKSGTVHEFTGSGAVGRALMTADVEDGDTFTVNGEPVTAYLGTDDATGSMAGSPWNGKWVSFIVDGSTLNFKGAAGGLKPGQLVILCAQKEYQSLNPKTYKYFDSPYFKGGVCTKACTVKFYATVGYYGTANPTVTVYKNGQSVLSKMIGDSDTAPEMGTVQCAPGDKITMGYTISNNSGSGSVFGVLA